MEPQAEPEAADTLAGPKEPSSQSPKEPPSDPKEIDQNLLDTPKTIMRKKAQSMEIINDAQNSINDAPQVEMHASGTLFIPETASQVPK